MLKETKTFRAMNVNLVNANHPKAMRLQGIGYVEGIEAKNIKVEDVLVWNYGSCSTVSKILKETAKTLKIQTKDERTGKFYERRLHKSRLVCIAKK